MEDPLLPLILYNFCKVKQIPYWEQISIRMDATKAMWNDDQMVIGKTLAVVRKIRLARLTNPRLHNIRERLTQSADEILQKGRPLIENN